MAPQIACVAPEAVFGEKACKAIIPPTELRSAMGELKHRPGVRLGRGHPLSNGNRRTIDNRGNMIVRRLHTMGVIVLAIASPSMWTLALTRDSEPWRTICPPRVA